MTKNEERLVNDLKDYGILVHYDNRKSHMVKLFKESVDKRVSKESREKAREELILINSRYVLFMGRKLLPEDYKHKDDLIQEGLAYLVEYIDRARTSEKFVKFVKKENTFLLFHVFAQICAIWKNFILDQKVFGMTECRSWMSRLTSLADLVEGTEDDYINYYFSGQYKREY